MTISFRLALIILGLLKLMLLSHWNVKLAKFISLIQSLSSQRVITHELVFFGLITIIVDSCFHVLVALFKWELEFERQTSQL